MNSPRYFYDNQVRGSDPFVIIQWTFEGEGLFEMEGKPHPVPAEHAFIAIVPERSSYSFPKTATEPWRFAWINFYGALGVSLTETFRRTFGPVPLLPRRSPAGALFLKLAESAQARAFLDPHETSAAAYGFLMEWARQLTRPARQEKDPVETALQICRGHFREPLGVKELAAETGLTREHFTRIFTERTGRAPSRYLRELRLDAARQMQQIRGVSLKEIALRCGFPSVRSLKQALESGDCIETPDAYKGTTR